MRVASSLIISLFLTATMSFALPVAIAGVVLGSTIIMSVIPGLMAIGDRYTETVLDFLAVFGTGSAFAGVVTLGLATSFVGLLFDLFNIYRFQTFRD